MSTQSLEEQKKKKRGDPEEQQKKKRSGQEEDGSIIDDILDTMGCYGCLFLPFRLLWGLIKFIVDIFD